MPPNPALQRIVDQEERLRLWSREPSGFPIWYSRRLAAYRRELTGGSAAIPKLPQTKSQIWRKDAALIRESASDLFRALTSNTPVGAALLFTSSGYRRRRPNGTAPCIFATHLERQLGNRLAVFELDKGNIPRAERPLNASSIELAFGPTYRFTRQLAHAKSLFTQGGRDDAAAFAAVGERSAAALALHARLVYEAAQRWFRYQRPRVIFVLCGYSHFTPFQLAAKHLNIPVIELQHGVIHESHPGYIFPALGERRFAELPVPDHLVVFGRYFGELLENNCEYWRDRWSVGGHPWLKETLQSAPELDAAEICFFSQCEAPVRERIRACATELGQLLPGVSIGIKPHPSEQDAAVYYASALAQGARLYNRGDDSYALLKRTKMAVCVHSTVVIEALAFPCLPVAIESNAWTEAIRVLVEGGQIRRANSGADLLALWQQRHQAPRTADAESMFAIGTPEPDFEQLIARVAERVKERRL